MRIHPDITENAKPASHFGDCPKRAAAFLDSLLRSGGALLWRENAWHVLTGAAQRSSPVSRYKTRMIAGLAARGLLTAGDDGLLRPQSQRAAPVTNMSESPLSRLSLVKREDGRPFFDDAQIRGGERLRRDYERAQLSQRVTVNYAAAEGGSGQHWRMSDNAVEKLSAAALSARQQVHAALSAVGPELSGILLHVCCLVAGLEEAERQLALPRRSGKAILALALTRLARHYGLKPALRHGGPQRIGHWAVPGSRPEIRPSAPPRHLP
ncbi:MAG: DUF6456 domain-containing protein [Proteobacteria bacterium]|nr:DUF6456 domain-containing protein [Pseudomonadota bacterium]